MAAVPSTITKMTSTSFSASVAVSFKREPSVLRGRWMPGVSTKTTWASAAGSCRTPRMRCRVVFGREEGIATLVPTMAFTRVDLPTLGRPTTATKPERTSSALVVRHVACGGAPALFFGLGRGAGRLNPDAADAAPAYVQRGQAEAVDLARVPGIGHPPGQVQDEAAHGVP